MWGGKGGLSMAFVSNSSVLNACNMCHMWVYIRLALVVVLWIVLN